MKVKLFVFLMILLLLTTACHTPVPLIDATDETTSVTEASSTVLPSEIFVSSDPVPESTPVPSSISTAESTTTTAVPTPTPSPTPVPTPTPDPLDEIFASEGEEVIEYYYRGELYDPYKDLKHLPDRWFYNSNTLYIDINRVYEPEKPLEYFVAEIRIRGDEKPYSIFNNPDKPGSRGKDQYIKAARLCRREGAIFAVNGDYMTYNEKEMKGPIIRNGICYWSGASGSGVEDTLIFLPDGSMTTVTPGTFTADELLDLGVEQTLNFGPTIVKDGKALSLEEMSNVRGINRLRNSRSAIGMIEPNHYIVIVAETLIPHSKGISLPDFAKLFVDHGCSVAYNLDGSASACMAFMGNMVNTVIDNGDTLKGPRPMIDMLAFGHTDDLPGMRDKYYNDGEYDGRD